MSVNGTRSLDHSLHSNSFMLNQGVKLGSLSVQLTKF